MRRDERRGPPPPPQRTEPPPPQAAAPDESRWAMQRRGGSVPAGANQKRPNELPVPPQYHEPQHPQYPHQHYPIPTRQGAPVPQPGPAEPPPGSLRGVEPRPAPRPAADYYRGQQPPQPQPEPCAADGLPLAEPLAVARAYPYPPAPAPAPQQRQQQPAGRAASPIRVQRPATSALTMQIARRAAGAKKPRQQPGKEAGLRPTDGVPVAFALALPVRARGAGGARGAARLRPKAGRAAS